MLHKEIIGLAFLLFLGWIFVSSSGTERIQHFCAPVSWVGNIAVSGAALASPDSQKSLNKTMNKVTYGCEYMVWRLFYQSTYNEYMASQGKPAYGVVPEPIVRDTPVEEPATVDAIAAKPVKPKTTPNDVVVEEPVLNAPRPSAAAPAPAEVPAKKSSSQKPVRVIE